MNASQDKRLHQSIATKIVNESPLHAWHAVFGGEIETPSDALDIGTVAHQIILGGTRCMEVIHHDDYRTAAAKQARDAARAAGKIPVKAKNAASIIDLVERVMTYLGDNDLALTGKSEDAIEWTEDGVECAGKIDHHWAPGRALILDLKFVDTANPAILPRKCIDYGYDIQAAAYTSAIEHIHPELRGRTEFLFVFAEKYPPYAITPARFAGSMRHLGMSRWARALDTWRDCMDKYGADRPWPGYGSEVERIVAPEWALKREMEVSEEFAASLEQGIAA